MRIALFNVVLHVLAGAIGWGFVDETTSIESEMTMILIFGVMIMIAPTLRKRWVKKSFQEKSSSM